ncbi:LysR family transcriptional regulator [Limnobaculum zhutongyuii]|uniref:LysR family transcriptional regulator n=1 Tax=Limnobaculum zhutongyuii TaxID=2498113 RepID=A0A411WQG6_9GAMM|nr:LysR substrate-binding domain-containing protein [Limnobaculum zhutongyuii]QBH98461.1 LysR family transcriptional regulator [Limnobaculum zhutongyuii]TQS89641.1 LysR family transcriptional regulator [Limnobaculum zhutongyuii]
MSISRSSLPLNEDLRVFLTVVRKHSFAKAAVELGVSPAYISKRINALEKVLDIKLFHRSTRSIVLTEDGEKARVWADRILGDLDDFISDVSEARHEPQGTLRIVSSFGFGRQFVAPAISQLAKQYPNLAIQLVTSDHVIDLVAEGFDLEIRVGSDLPNHYMAKKLLDNQRVLCASPAYLAAKGQPETLDDLARHDCLVIKERDTPFGSWLLSGKDEKPQTVRVDGRLSSNSGAIVLQWGLEGHGIFLRSMWDAKRYIDEGKLINVLPEYSQSADIWAVYPMRLSNSAKLKVCVEFLQLYFKWADIEE